MLLSGWYPVGNMYLEGWGGVWGGWVHVMIHLLLELVVLCAAVFKLLGQTHSERRESKSKPYCTFFIEKQGLFL
jgi:uncharacterized membrane protein